MSDSREWFVRTENGKVYGPADVSALAEWARDGRVEPSCFVSCDRINWKPAQLMPELEMKWIVETEPGRFYGPFHRQVVSRLFRDGLLAATAKAYRLHEFAIDEDPPPVERVVEVEKVVEKEVRVEVPVEKVVERIVEKEVRVEVPVERVVEKVVEKVVEVAPPPRTELIVPEVVEPSGKAPPTRAPGSLFDGLGRDRMAALEAAARRELARGRRLGISTNLFGRRNG